MCNQALPDAFSAHVTSNCSCCGVQPLIAFRNHSSPNSGRFFATLVYRMDTFAMVALCLIAIYMLLDLLAPTREGMRDGVRRRNIPEGHDDLYILKSEIVPPVCPACPSVEVCPKAQKKCRPCPPCGRCPEPAFECKKVPNYNSPSSQLLPGFYGNASISGSASPIGGSASSSQPMPVLNSFADF